MIARKVSTCSKHIKNSQGSLCGKCCKCTHCVCCWNVCGLFDRLFDGLVDRCVGWFGWLVDVLNWLVGSFWRSMSHSVGLWVFGSGGVCVLNSVSQSVSVPVAQTKSMVG
jgi:hypothetical protein